MKKNLTILLFIFLFCDSFGQKISVNSLLKTSKTEIKTKNYLSGNDVILISSFERIVDGAREVLFFKRSLGGNGIRLILTDTINLSTFIYADFDKFDGKNEKVIDAKYYVLKINKTNYKPGDTIMAKLQLRSKLIEDGFENAELTYMGDLFHILKN